MEEPGRRLPLQRERDRRPRALARLSCCPPPAAAASPSSRRTTRSASSNTPIARRRAAMYPGFSTQRRLTRASCAANAAENGSSCTSRSGPVTSLRSANSRSNSAGTSAQSNACSRTLSARGGAAPPPGARSWLARSRRPPRGARGPTVTNARVRSSLSRTENSIGPAAVAGSTSTMIPSRAAGSSSATAGVASSAASTSSDDGPSPVARRGMSGTIGGTFGPMSAGSVSSGGYAAGRARLEAIAGVAGARQRDVVVARPGRKRQADLVRRRGRPRARARRRHQLQRVGPRADRRRRQHQRAVSPVACRLRPCPFPPAPPRSSRRAPQPPGSRATRSRPWRRAAVRRRFARAAALPPAAGP